MQNGDQQDKSITCPECKAKHSEDSDSTHSNRGFSHGATKIFATSLCPICDEKKKPMIALPCGHVVCPMDFEKLGGAITENTNPPPPRQDSNGSTNNNGNRRRREAAGGGGVDSDFASGMMNMLMAGMGGRGFGGGVGVGPGFMGPPLDSDEDDDEDEDDVSEEMPALQGMSEGRDSSDDDSNTMPPLSAAGNRVLDESSEDDSAEDDESEDESFPDLLDRDDTDSSGPGAESSSVDEDMPSLDRIRNGVRGRGVNRVSTDDDSGTDVDSQGSELPDLYDGPGDSSHTSGDSISDEGVSDGGGVPALVHLQFQGEGISNFEDSSGDELSFRGAEDELEGESVPPLDQRQHESFSGSSSSGSTTGSLPSLDTRGGDSDDSDDSSIPNLQNFDGHDTDSSGNSSSGRQRQVRSSRQRGRRSGAQRRAARNRNRSSQSAAPAVPVAVPQTRPNTRAGVPDQAFLKDRPIASDLYSKSGEILTDLVAKHYRRKKAVKDWQRKRALTPRLQACWRGYACRNFQHADVVALMEERKRFKERWSKLFDVAGGESIKQLPNSWETLKRDKFNMARVLDDMMEEDDETREALESAAAAAIAFEEEEENDGGIDEELFERAIQDSAVENSNAEKLNRRFVEAAESIKLTHDVMKWLKFSDRKLTDFFIRRMRQLASGERSRILAKGLVGCKTTIFETYLEQKYGKRIIWTPCKEEDGSDTILVWNVVDHKKVSRYLSYIDDAEKRSTRGLVSAASLFGNECASGEVMALGKNAILLDPMADSPLKMYQVGNTEVPWLEGGDWEPPLRLTADERSCVEKDGTVLLLGRSGTGKTICICNRMNFDRVRSQDRPLKQLFVARSGRLCSQVKDIVEKTHCLDDSDSFRKKADYIKFKQFIDKLNKDLPPGDGDLPMPLGRHVDYHRYKKEFYNTNFELHSLVIWTQIRSFIKGSYQAVEAGRPLSLEEYMNLGKSDCRLAPEDRRKAYVAFETYQRQLREGGFWDDNDMATKILRNYNRADDHTRLDMQYDKIYVDEVQDYTQAELAIFYRLCSQGGLFFAGDTAQSVVEGVTFRFEDLRVVAYGIYGGDPRYIPHKPLKVKVNFRSHSGVLRLAGEVLDKLSWAFPESFNKLDKEEGYYIGPRPGVFKKLDVSGLRSLMRRNEGLLVLTHDEYVQQLQDELIGNGEQDDAVGQELAKWVLGIRDAKGLEFSDIIIVNFFAGLASEHQKPWKALLKDLDHPDRKKLEDLAPELEPQMKLLYTAITRCSKRLFFVETKKSVAGDAFVRWLTDKKLAESQDATKVERVLTPDEWRSSGVDCATNAESSDSPSQSIEWIERSIRCFDRVDEASLDRKARLHLDSLHLRAALENMAPSERLDEERQAEVVKMATACAEGGLVPEAYKLVSAAFEFVGSYEQEKLQTLVLEKLEMFAD